MRKNLAGDLYQEMMGTAYLKGGGRAYGISIVIFEDSDESLITDVFRVLEDNFIASCPGIRTMRLSNRDRLIWNC